MHRLTGTCQGCGAPFATTSGEDAFCEYCDFPLPTPLSNLPKNSATLRQLLVECGTRKDWRGAAQVIERMIEELPTGWPEAQYRCLLGTIRAEHLHQVDEAIASWREALQADPTHVAAFLRLARVLAARGQYAELERSYKTLIAALVRSRAAPDVIARRWDELAVLYRTHLGQSAAADTCAQEARRLRDGI